MATIKNLQCRLGETWVISIACTGLGGAALEDMVDFQFRMASAKPELLLDLAATESHGAIEISENIALISITPGMQEDAGLIPLTGSWEGRAILSDGTPSDQAGGDFKIVNSLFVQFP